MGLYTFVCGEYRVVMTTTNHIALQDTATINSAYQNKHVCSVMLHVSSTLLNDIFAIFISNYMSTYGIVSILLFIRNLNIKGYNYGVYLSLLNSGYLGRLWWVSFEFRVGYLKTISAYKLCFTACSISACKTTQVVDGRLNDAN